MMHTLPKFLPLCAALVAAPLAAQMTVLLPGHADISEGHHSVGLPFGAPGFRTQLLVDAASIAQNGGAITGLRLRADRTSLPLTATSVPNVTVSLSHSTQFVGGMSDTFVNNVTETPVVVFQGTVQLPGQTSGYVGPMPWDIVITFQQPFAYATANGQLLVDIVGNNPAGGQKSYWLDAVEAGGAATPYGANGDNPTGDFLNLIVSTNNSLDPRLLTIGRTIDFTSGLSFSAAPGLLLLGVAPQPAPIDLGPIGAPTNSLYVDPIVLAPHSWTQSFIGFYSTFSVNVPNVPTLVHERLFAQSLILEPTANALGLVFSSAWETRIGDPAEVLPVQQLDVDDPAAPVGVLLDFGFGGSPAWGAVALQLEGAFF